MKMSYKIALIVSLAVCILAVVMFTDSSGPDETTPDTTQADTQPQAEVRQSLRNDSSPDVMTPSATGRPADAATALTRKSLAQDVRSRMQAVDDAPADESVMAASQAKPSEGAVPDAISLTRTDPDVPNQTIESKPKNTPAISRENLDAILGMASGSSASPLSDATEDTITEGALTKTQPGTLPAFAGGTYTVQPGDTFSEIAFKHYGEESKWFDIAQANPKVDPTRLRVGQALKLPARVALQEVNEPLPPAPEGVKTYTIRPGDSLSTVAKVYYGDPTLWRTIYNFNRDKIGDNPNAIQAGMALKVPPRVTGAR